MFSTPTKPKGNFGYVYRGGDDYHKDKFYKYGIAFFAKEIKGAEEYRRGGLYSQSLFRYAFKRPPTLIYDTDERFQTFVTKMYNDKKPFEDLLEEDETFDNAFPYEKVNNAWKRRTTNADVDYTFYAKSKKVFGDDFDGIITGPEVILYDANDILYNFERLTSTDENEGKEGNKSGGKRIKF